MALYVEFKCAGGNAKPKPILACWHSKFPELALATEDGAINLFTDEAERQEFTILREDQVCTSMSWHPNKKILSVGWSDGKVSFFDETAGNIKEPPISHDGKVVNCKWNETGDLCITCDEKGNVILWIGDKTKFQSIAKYSRDGLPNTQIVFRNRSNRTDNYFFFGGDKGTVYYADDKGNFKVAFTLGDFAPLSAMFYWRERDSLVISTKTSFLYRYGILPDGRMDQQLKVKLSSIADGNSIDQNLIVKCIEDGLYVSATNENAIRFWDLEKEKNYILNLPNEDEKVTSLDFQSSNQTLAVCVGNKIYFYAFVGENAHQNWALQPVVVDLASPSTDITWGPSGYLAARLSESISMLVETILHRRMHSHLAGIQVAASKIAMEKFKSPQFVLKTSLACIKGFEIYNDYLVAWSGKKVEIYEVKDNHNFHHISTFKSLAIYAAVHSESVILALPLRLEICNFQGVCKQTLSFNESEGDPQFVNICGNFLIAVSTRGIMKCWDLSRREARPQGAPKKLEEVGPKGIGRVVSAKINSKGTHVCLLTSVVLRGSSARVPSTCVFIYEIEKDFMITRNFEPNTPTNITWDCLEPRLLAIEVSKKVKEKVSSEIFTVFVSSEAEDVVSQDTFPIPENCHSLLGLQVPHIFFSKNSTPELIEGKVLRDFLGMDDVDDQTKEAILNFSFYLSVGNMDEAYKAVKLIQNPHVWENMAIMCVKTKRLDVAEVCLANMGNARGCRALREAKNEPEIEARLAVVAIELKLYDEAEQLYIQCGRYDLLNQLYQSRGDWKKAQGVAERWDRIHFRTTYYRYAKYLESVGDTSNAVKQYESSDTHRVEVPRMLFESENLEDLEAYVIGMKDKQLTEWWARYTESKGNFNRALEYYSKAEDYLSIVRVFCFQKRIDEARKIVTESDDKAAAYHLAKHYESEQNIKEAILFYFRAACYHHGIRLAVEHEMDTDVLNLALQAPQKLMIEAAKYFEDREKIDQAILLYHKAQSLNKAISLCFQSGKFDQLGAITNSLSKNTAPAVLSKCIDYFTSQKMFDRVVNLHILTGNISKAIDICLAQKVPMNEELADKMTPDKDSDPNLRQQVLLAVAKVAKRQGNYPLATKKYTQAKDKVKAMKCLLKAGDTEKIIFFTNVSKQKDLYIMAGNYLQKLDWRSNPEILKNIIHFYTKAQVPESIALFYDHCAIVEVEEYKNYEKALGALKEAAKYIAKAKHPGRDNKFIELKKRISATEQFLTAKKLFESAPEEALVVCSELLQMKDLEVCGVKFGDVYAMIVEYYYSQGKYAQAYEVIDQMKKTSHSDLLAYLDKRTVLHIYQMTKHNIDFPLEEEENSTEALPEEISQ